jgi:hypothetical protein
MLTAAFSRHTVLVPFLVVVSNQLLHDPRHSVEFAFGKELETELWVLFNDLG